jgi:hypothetical protein
MQMDVRQVTDSVTHAADWPYRGELNILEWHDQDIDLDLERAEHGTRGSRPSK